LRGKQQRAGNDQGGNHSFHWLILTCVPRPSTKFL
jgi:hypothetical protein